jgi:serine protease Do
VIRASSSFRLGASGSAMLDQNGALIGINTFMSPGPRSYFYSMPVDWIKALLVSGDETTSLEQKEAPFWDAPEAEQPYFMRVVIPALGEHWQTLARIAEEWVNDEPDNAEAWYYRGMAEERQGNDDDAHVYLQKALKLNPQHADALLEIGLIASRQGDEAELRRVGLILNGLDADAAEALRKATTVSN